MGREDYYGGQNNSLQNNGYSVDEFYGQNSGCSQSGTYGQNSTDYSAGGNSSVQRSTRSKSALEKLYDKLPVISVIGKIAIFGYYLSKMAGGIMEMVNQRGGFDLNLIFPILPNFMAMMVMYMGWSLLVDFKGKLVKQRKKCTDAVMAVLVDYKIVVKNNGDGETTNSYYAVYNYTYNDVTYRATSDIEYVFSESREENNKNFECKILVNPKNPMEIYEVDQEYVRSKTYRITGIVGFIFFSIVAYLVSNCVF